MHRSDYHSVEFTVHSEPPFLPHGYIIKRYKNSESLTSERSRLSGLPIFKTSYYLRFYVFGKCTPLEYQFYGCIQRINQCDSTCSYTHLYTVSSEGYISFTKVIQLYAQNSFQKNTTTKDTYVYYGVKARRVQTAR